MQHRGNFRQSNMIYGATSRSRQHPHPYPQTSPATVYSLPNIGIPVCEDQFDKGLGYSDDCYSPTTRGGLINTLSSGSALLPPYTAAAFNQNTPDKHFDLLSTESHRSNRSSTQDLWNSSAPTLMSPPVTPSSSQTSFTSLPSKELNGSAGNRFKPLKRSQSGPSKRPTPDNFRSLILFPRNHEELLHDYVGTDSKYTLAKNHAGIFVRSSIKSLDMAGKMREVAEALDAIDLFLAFLLEHQGLRPEQKGCLSLRICFGALTALLGDFSQGNSVENFVSDPHAAVIPREHLAQFRTFNPKLHEILRRLSAKLERSMNLYRHRRSPSGSLVAKFQEMSDTLEVWNQHLTDDTFFLPSKIASDWLKNHPNQVDSRRRNQAYNEQTSPSLSDTTRPSPTEGDSNYLSPMSAYADPSRSPNRANMRPNVMDGSVRYESLFGTSPSTSGVTYFPSTSISSGSMQFNHPNLYRTAGGLDEGLSHPSLPDLAMFTHQSHSANAGQYQGTGSGYQGFD